MAPSKSPRSEKRAQARKALSAQEEDWGDDAFMEFSWRQRKAIAVACYCRAREMDWSKTDALVMASVGARVRWRCAHEWIKDWRNNEGVFSASTWGKAKQLPDYFREVEVIPKKWWAAKKSRKGVPCLPPACLVHGAWSID